MAAKPASAPPGALIDIGGRRLHGVRAGPAGARPLVLLEAGSFGFSADWSVVQQRLAERGYRSLAYDRAGLGESDTGPLPRDGLAIAEDLEALLRALGETGPLIYVGHSMAGLHAAIFAAGNPGLIAGLVLVDAVTPEAAGQPLGRRIARQYVRLARTVAWAAGAGLLRPLSALGDTIGLPEEAAARKRWAFGHAGHNRAAADEVAAWLDTAQQALAAGPFDPAWPVAVVTAGPAGVGGAQKAVLSEPARRSRHGHIATVARANHADLLGRKHAGTIVEAVEYVHGRLART
jgi:pimeloyl-ACP methyl ester carboxylesterase